MSRRPSAKKLARDRWKARVIEGMTPELRAELTPAQVMFLWAKATNGDTFFFDNARTVFPLVDKGLIVYVATSGTHKLTQKGARWALRILDIYNAVPTGEGPYGAFRRAGYEGTVRVSNGEPRELFAS